MGYRDLRGAIRSHIEALGDERREIGARLSDSDALRARKIQIHEELAAAYEALDEAEGTRRLPILASAGVASPCDEDWNGMLGDDRVRFCDRCSQHVYDLSAMSADEAEAFLYTSEGQVCVRFFRRADGTILTKDCPLGRRRKLRRRGLLAGLGLATVTAALAGAQSASEEATPAKPAEARNVEEAQLYQGYTMGIATPEQTRLKDDRRRRVR